MKNSLSVFGVFMLLLCLSHIAQGQSKHQDEPFRQEIAIKFPGSDSHLKKVFADRNGTIQLIGQEGLHRPTAGAFLYPGKIVTDKSYLPMKDKDIRDMDVYRQQFVYLTDQAVLSNAWAGSLYIPHDMPSASFFKGGKDFSFLVTDGNKLAYYADSSKVWEKDWNNDPILELLFVEDREKFYVLSGNTLTEIDPDKQILKGLYQGPGLKSMDWDPSKNQLILATGDGYFYVDPVSGSQVGNKETRLPWPELTNIKVINGNLWFGSQRGAFMQREDGKYNYYYGERWLPGEKVTHIFPGGDDAVLILTDGGLGKLQFFEQTLHKKAEFFDKQVRERHIRYGFNASLVDMENGNFDQGRLGDSDNDGLWTSMYLAGEAFRYAVSGEEEALQNVQESLDAMERLFTINPVEGFPSRSFARRGYIDVLADPERWQHASHPEWDWKATTSSDEAIGHAFVFGVIAEIVEDEEIKQQAIALLDGMMQHIVDNDWYLIDYDGEPTLWGKWHPDYVNAFPTIVGDRKLNSSNIIAMLQTAFHFTGKEVYKEKAFMLMNDHGYLDNLMRPMEEIGKAQEGTDEWAEMLSESWNHSDDEMYFLGYWGLYRYAFNDTLKAKYKEAIMDHWEAERPEKDGLWNIFTALVSPDNFDLEEAIWYLQEYPYDLVNWTMRNSHRRDIELLEENFRRQSTKEVLPPDELPIRRHNANRFGLNGGNGGRSENSAGDIWLLPYWMGRYLDVISAPQE
ncbi:hypothetical protein [Pleomorphovibrio marinus]|uniref:hypothetical protein n=1 Tax=Pleomorphovibrio marinus TaxID=2164132 RepID=UPI000E0AE28F|nr:hypothetical protein [Pleomorphovibrio marinus]